MARSDHSNGIERDSSSTNGNSTPAVPPASASDVRPARRARKPRATPDTVVTPPVDIGAPPTRRQRTPRVGRGPTLPESIGKGVADLAAGRSKTFDNVNELVTDLHTRGRAPRMIGDSLATPGVRLPGRAGTRNHYRISGYTTLEVWAPHALGALQQAGVIDEPIRVERI